MARIFARSPFIIDVNEVNMIGSKIDVYIGQGMSLPAQPTYILSKNSPSVTNYRTVYNISPYIREKINHNTYQSTYNTFGFTPSSQYSKVRIVRYKRTMAGTSLLDTTDYIAFDGYGFYEEGYNPQLETYFLSQGTYYYNYDVTADFATEPLTRCGHLNFEADSNYTVKYTNLNTAATFTHLVPSYGIREVPRVYSPYYLAGNKVELFDDLNVLIATWYFRPIVECRYEPVVVDFVNKFGAWQREWFFKASFEQHEVKTTPYNLLQSNLVNYSVTQGQRRDFNINGQESIKVNSGSVNEVYYSTLLDVIMSERIMVNGKPAVIKSKSIAKLKDVNTKTFNYTLEFEYAFNTINNVI
jgi:hypothetical protein